MEGRHWNATTGENNSAKSWRDWFVLFAFGTAYAITYHAPSRRHLPAAHVSTAVLKGGLALHKTALHVQGTSSKTGQAAASGGSLVASKTLSPVAVRLQRYARGWRKCHPRRVSWLPSVTRSSQGSRWPPWSRRSRSICLPTTKRLARRLFACALSAGVAGPLLGSQERRPPSRRLLRVSILFHNDFQNELGQLDRKFTL